MTFLFSSTALLAWVGPGIFLWGAAMPAVGRTASESALSAGKRLVERYNSRSLGSPGWRRIQIDLRSDSRLTRSFTVVNFWLQDRGKCYTLTYLEEPEAMRGIRYLQLEDPDLASEMRVYLNFPVGRRSVISLEPELHDQGLLGSDYSYNDIRMHLPSRGRNYILAGEATLGGQPVWKIEATPEPGSLAGELWSRIDYFISKDSPFLLGADYFNLGPGDSARLLKSMRVTAFRDSEGVRTAETMIMRSATGQSTTLVLKAARFGLLEMDAGLFAPGSLPEVEEIVSKMGPELLRQAR